MVGRHDDLENQLTTWEPGSNESPDRLDALVWALTELMLSRTVSFGGGFTQDR
jgi:phage terminase large subunit-like protein